jgi:hypothetical protein
MNKNRLKKKIKKLLKKIRKQQTEMLALGEKVNSLTQNLLDTGGRSPHTQPRR